MSDVVAHHITDEESGNKDADHRIEQIEVVGSIDHEIHREQVLEGVDEPFQNQCGRCSRQSGEEGENQHELLLGEMLLSPSDNPFDHFMQ